MTLTEHLLMESITKLKEEQGLLEETNAANEELVAQVIVERDKYRRLLQEVLAVIHRDGGHHTESRGLEASCLDAMEKGRTLQQETDALAKERDLLRARLRGPGGYY